MWSYKFFRIGALALVVTGVIHMLGFYASHNTTPANGTEHYLRDLMIQYKFNLMGTMRSMSEIQDGLSLAFAVFCWALGAIGFTVPVEKKTAVVYAVSLGALLIISLVYWFLAPTACLTICVLLFAASALLNR